MSELEVIENTSFAPVMGLFHLLHGVFPCRLTSHEYWGIRGKDKI